MSALAIAGWSFPVLLGLIFLRLPIGLAMLVCGIGGGILVNGWLPVLAQLKTLTYDTFSNHSLSVLPLFLLMGQFAGRGGMSRALFQAARAWVGHRRGGVAMAAIGACAGFGAICGSSLATAATMGQVALPELRRIGYAGSFATGCLAAGGTLGILIPPSIVLVVYAILAEQNIAKLFVAAILPGLLATAGYLVTIAVYVRLRPAVIGPHDPTPDPARWQSLLGVWPVLLIFGAVIGGIYLGIFTPTEGAAVGAFGTGLLAAFSPTMTWQAFAEAILETAVATAMIYFIVLGAAVFNAFLAVSQLPQAAAGWVVAQGFSPMHVLIAILLLYLVLGCIMDSLSMILLTVPIFLPIVTALDFGLPAEEFAIWFGILVLIVVEVGLITPPVGLNLFVINALARWVPLGQTYRGVLPFILSDLIRVTLLTAFPVLSLLLVRLLY